MELWIIVLVLVSIAVWTALRRAPTRQEPLATPAPAPTPQPAAEHAQPASLQELADAIRPLLDASSHPSDMLEAPPFQTAVARLTDPAVTLEEVINYTVGANGILNQVGAEALARRTDSAAAVPRVVRYLRHANVWTAFFILRFLTARAETPVIASTLLECQDWWPRNPLLPKIVSDFIDAQVARGEAPDLPSALEQQAPGDADSFVQFLDQLTGEHAEPLRESYRSWLRSRVDRNALNAVGQVWVQPLPGPPVCEHERLREGVEVALEALQGARPLSFLIVGEAGVGKTTLFRALGERLMESGWTLFQASAADVIAGQVYIGELERRMRELLANLSADRRAIWYVPNFHELLYAGRHRLSPVGVLDLILPAVEAGTLCVVGETEPAALEKVIQQRPRLRTAFRRLLVEALPDAEALDLAATVAARELGARNISVEPQVLREALELSNHYLSGRAQPGRLLGLLRATATRLESASGPEIPLSRDDLLLTVSELTGLPRNILDEREGLDPRVLRALFGRRVMGQPEAIDCLVDRVAMLKAGLTDPNRPIGVFLFAGPTGTGKTEAAKTLAECLFGSADRMIRLDMSEFQEPVSVARIVGDAGEGGETDALVNRIRKQPFSVVLLDEFEKAHPRIWDMFLQVFDAARLTDALGSIADFRYSIIILTTNLGAIEHRGTSLGFTDGATAFTEAQVLRTIGQTFRPEFVNRLDRIVVFRPLSKAVMRDILRKELSNVLQRRGFRHREWAVEWEESAIDFLLDKGFTQDMGARPLRRAIEQHVLAPIAMTIVEHRFPEGDQFLFVRSDGRGIQAQFVDPDAPAALSGVDVPPSAGTRLPGLILSSSGSSDETEVLERELIVLEELLAGAAWSERKQALFERMNERSFWDRPDRHETLVKIELRDRIEAATGAARSLARRLTGRSQRQSTAPRMLVESLAQQIYLLRTAHLDLNGVGTCDAYLSVEVPDGQAAASVASWAQRIAGMYREWARKRHMRASELSAGGPFVLAVSGLGAHHILARETGLHVFETPDASGGFDRSSVRVRVVPQPFAPRLVQQPELQHALASLAAVAGSTAIVRRYRELPSPLVRDALTGGRSGRLDQVLSGDFDLMLEPETEQQN